MGAAASTPSDPPHTSAASTRPPAALVVCGPSGVGKGTLIKRLVAAQPDAFGFSCSHTTRAPREGEQVRVGGGGGRPIGRRAARSGDCDRDAVDSRPRRRRGAGDVNRRTLSMCRTNDGIGGKQAARRPPPSNAPPQSAPPPPPPLPLRPPSQDGVHYHFTSRDAFEAAIEAGDFIEHAHVHGHLYGTSTAAVAAVAAAGKTCILDIDVQGARSVRAARLPAVFVFVAPPSLGELEARLRGRGTETEAQIGVRLKNAKEELER